MSEAHLPQAHEEAQRSAMSILQDAEGGCFQLDGCADPNHKQVFNFSLGAPMPFHLIAFRLDGDRESAASLSKILREKVKLIRSGSGSSTLPWREAHAIGLGLTLRML